jgi:cysteine-rich repeat protein
MAGEQCDDGGTTAACDADCTTNVCGDGFFNFITEQCDDGNMNDGDGCSSTCLSE